MKNRYSYAQSLINNLCDEKRYEFTLTGKFEDVIGNKLNKFCYCVLATSFPGFLIFAPNLLEGRSVAENLWERSLRSRRSIRGQEASRTRMFVYLLKSCHVQ